MYHELKREHIDYLVVHASYTPPSMDIGVEDIAEWHRDKGWEGCGYHFVIRRDGTIERGRPITAMGAHTKGHNHESMGVCLAGGADESFDHPENNFNQEQIKSLFAVILMAKAFIDSGISVVGHRDLTGDRTCPCFSVRQLMEGTPIEEIDTHPEE